MLDSAMAVEFLGRRPDGDARHGTESKHGY